MTELDLQPTRFKKFLNMAFMFKKQGLVQETTIQPITREERLESSRLSKKQKAKQLELKAKLDIRFDELVSQKDKNKVVLILERGYEINSTQALSLMKDEFNHPVIQSAILKIYNESMKDEFKKEIETLIEDKKIANKELPLYHLANKAILIWNHVNLMEFLEDPKYATDFSNDCNRLKSFFETTPFMYLQTNKRDFIKVLDKYITYIEDKHSEYINNQFLNELDSYSLVFNNFEKIKENMTAGMLDNIKKFSEIDLPLEAQARIREITNIANEIGPNTLSVEQNLQFNNIYKKRFSQVLEEYVSISPRYREKLKSHDENPDTLLLESLDDIKTKLDSLFDVVQNSKYNRQKITRQYLKNV